MGKIIIVLPILYRKLKNKGGEEVVSKRFPASTSMDYLTFLNDKRIDAELYALMQEYSFPYEGGTRVDHTKFLTQAEICDKLEIKSPKTLRTHLNYLIETGYVKMDGKDFILPNCEDIYMLIPLETLRYLNYNCKDHVMKVYIYLGQRYKYAKALNRNYLFTLTEIGEHLGLGIKHHGSVYNHINYALEILENSGLIKYQKYYDGTTIRLELLEWNVDYKKHVWVNLDTLEIL